MERETWAEVRALFEAALARTPAERGAFVRAAPADPAVRDEVLSLIAHADDGGSGPGAGWLDPPSASIPQADGGMGLAGQRFGAWVAEQQLGSGGMGEVWEARRADGAYDAVAALKLLRPGLDTGPLLRRFQQERRALARMEHPNIARLLDAGMADGGRPYVVMERVQGEPIDRAVQGRPLRERIALFLQLADAVAHAHRQLLVHRDLKPGNVLVDRDGRVKLLDFGIAKALEATDADADLTQDGQRPFTPWYASPEQVRGEPVATATDIYSLGALLYQLLTGQRPYVGDLRTPQQVARAVLEQAPVAPSQRPPDAATEAQVPRRRLRGDLDNIVLKALAKRPQDRYASVDALAADLRSWLDGRPVLARPPSPWHRARLFAARHAVAVTVGALGAAGIVAALVLALWQARQAEQARVVAQRQAAQTRQLAKDLVFKYHDQIASLSGATAVRDGLLADAARYLDALRAEDAAERDPTLARDAAEAYLRIAVLQGEQFSPSQERLAEAAANLDKALALLPRYIDRPDASAAALHSAADMWLAKAGQAARRADLGASLQALQRARALAERAVSGDPEDVPARAQLATVEGRVGLALGGSVINANLGRNVEALPHFERSDALMRALHERHPEQAERAHQHAWSSMNLANARLLAGRWPEAVDAARRAVRLRDEAAGRMPANAHFGHQRAIARLVLSQTLAYAGEPAAALAAHDEAMGLLRASAAADTANRSAQRDLTLSDLAHGRVLAMTGQPEAAERALTRALSALPVTQEGDFYLQRLRAETLLWLARVAPRHEARQGLLHAKEARALMAPPAGRPADNASRAWAEAMAIGEQAAALRALGDDPAARAAAAEALAAWRAAPGDGVPPMLQRWAERDRGLAAR